MPTPTRLELIPSESDVFAFGKVIRVSSVIACSTPFGQGGGIFNGGALAVDHSSINQTTASISGGGIYVCLEGQVVLPGFPFFLPQCHGTLTLNHTSVTENTPDDIFP